MWYSCREWFGLGECSTRNGFGDGFFISRKSEFCLGAKVTWALHFLSYTGFSAFTCLDVFVLISKRRLLATKSNIFKYLFRL